MLEKVSDFVLDKIYYNNDRQLESIERYYVRKNSIQFYPKV